MSAIGGWVRVDVLLYSTVHRRVRVRDCVTHHEQPNDMCARAQTCVLTVYRADV